MDVGSINRSINSSNWAGYVVTASTGAVNSVTGSWIVPSVTNPSTNETTTYYSSFWIGIDGFNSGTVEQIGTDSDIKGTTASYYAWYDLYPQTTLRTINTLTISPGDVMSAIVTYSPKEQKISGSDSGNSTGMFTLMITDETTGKYYSTTGTVSNAARSSAEWIAETPSSSNGMLPLADFDKVKFGEGNTASAGTCSATINGVSGPISSTSYIPINIAKSKNVQMASPSGLTSDGTSFVVTWENEGS